MPYYIQFKHHWESQWKTATKSPFETAVEALEHVRRIGYKIGDECRVVESYTVTRYKAVKI